MKLSTGKIGFPIEFDNGDKDIIYFNPNDPDLIVRMKDFEGYVNKRIDGIKDIELLNDGTPANNEDMQEVENFRMLKNILCEELDRAFKGEISAIVFKHCSPFAIVNGNYFILQFLEAIVPEIEKEIKKANNAVEKRMAKHTNKYIKK